MPHYRGDTLDWGFDPSVTAQTVGLLLIQFSGHIARLNRLKGVLGLGLASGDMAHSGLWCYLPLTSHAD